MQLHHKSPKTFIALSLLFLSIACFSQSIVDGITQKTYDNALNTYNFTCWDSSFKTSVTTRKFSNQTSSYNLSVNYSTLNINSLAVNTQNTQPSAAFSESVATTFSSTQPGNIDYKYLFYLLIDNYNTAP